MMLSITTSTPSPPPVPDTLLHRARNALPGGVNSPVRAFRALERDPFFVSEAHGASLTTTDGAELIDFVMSWGPLLLGHDSGEVRAAVADALSRGVSFGVTCEAEVALADLVIALVPSIEMVRFVNSGTEATMAAVRLARAATGRDLVLKFEGCYHGHADSFLVAAGSGVATLGLPDSPGVPADLARLTVTVPYNDGAAVQAAFDEHDHQFAAVIVEPFMGNAGFIRPQSGFLECLREITTSSGAVLIFDEVMTGFRVALGGAQSLTGVTPDLTTLGKVIGGGLPVGAYGGSRELMERVAPSGPVYQAGTLSGNPLAMAAGIATLEVAQQPGTYEALDRKSARMVSTLIDAAAAHGIPFSGDSAGGMWGVFFHDGPVTDFAAAKNADTALYSRWHAAALDRGVFLAPSAFEAAFVSTAHDDDTLATALDRLTAALADAAHA